MRRLINFFLEGYETTRQYRLAKNLWRLTLAGIAAVLVLFIALSFSNLPSVAELENPKSNEASLVYAEDGSLLGKFYTDNRVPVGYDDLPEHLVQALVSTEDERYFEHRGIDFRSLGRAVAYMGQKGGASTITQQLAKLLFTGERSKKVSNAIVQKLREWIIAVRLERKYTKEEIIALYLNRYDFINNAKGIRAAAEIYFSKSPSDLNVQESAMLVGMLKNASLYNPRRFADRTLKRREVVLSQMSKAGHLSQEAYDELRKTPLGLNMSSQTHLDGLAPYFRMVLGEELKELFKRPEMLKPDGTSYDVYRDGLRIYTTINPRMQAIAEAEMEKHMAKLQRSFFRHWQGRDPWTYTRNSETEVPVERRKASLNSAVRMSDRYQALRSQYLDEICAALNEETGLVFHEDDREVDRIVQEDEKGNVISGLVRDGLLSNSLASQYRKVLRSAKYPELKKQWKALQAASDKVFNRPVKMRVFAYGDEMEKDTTMSPYDSVRYHRMILQTGMMAIEPGTGYVRAWVGGVNFKWFKYDHVNRNTRRQVGSTFKPFVYASTIDLRGISPCQQFPDVAVTIRPGEGQFNLIKSWTPANADNRYSGRFYNLMDGLRQSKNTISVTLMKELGSVEPVREVVSMMGIDKSVIPLQPSICLGAVDLSVQEMAGAYTTFANNGIYHEPVYILRIEDRMGREIYASTPSERQVFQESANYAMTELLQYAVENRGKVRGTFGGKTGTTNEHADGWFMGVTPDLVVGVWAGGDDRWIAFRDLSMGQGSYMAKPFVLNFLTSLQTDESFNWDFEKRFYKPDGPLAIEMDCGAYYQSTSPVKNDDEYGIDNTPDFEE